MAAEHLTAIYRAACEKFEAEFLAKMRDGLAERRKMISWIPARLEAETRKVTIVTRDTLKDADEEIAERIVSITGRTPEELISRLAQLRLEHVDQRDKLLTASDVAQYRWSVEDMMNERPFIKLMERHISFFNERSVESVALIVAGMKYANARATIVRESTAGAFVIDNYADAIREKGIKDAAQAIKELNDELEMCFACFEQPQCIHDNKRSRTLHGGWR